MVIYSLLRLNNGYYKYCSWWIMYPLQEGRNGWKDRRYGLLHSKSFLINLRLYKYLWNMFYFILQKKKVINIVLLIYYLEKLL